MLQYLKRCLSVWLSVMLLLGLLPTAFFAAAEPVNLMKNGDFEAGTGAAWELGPCTEVSVSAARTGGHGLHIDGDGGWYEVFCEQTISGLSVGETYCISLWYKALVNGAVISVVAGSEQPVYTYVNETSWTLFETEFTATATTAVFSVQGTGIVKTAELYVDDVTLTEVSSGGSQIASGFRKIETLLERVKTQGRTALIDGTLMLDFSISGLEFELNCSGDVYATFNARKLSNTSSTGGVYFTVVVDGVMKARDDCRIASVGETRVKLAGDLPAGKHTFAIYRQTEHSYGEVGISGLTYDGEMLDKPAANSQYIEFIGDSISCGFGNLGTNSQGDGAALWSDGTQAYPFLTAQTLRADWSNVSWSGLGCKYGYSSTTMQDVYPAQRYNYDRKTPYAFAKEPDVVILALGTNDHSMQSNMVLRRAGLKEMLTLVRQKNPHAPIVWIYNMMTDGVNGMIEDIVKEFGGEKAGYYTCKLSRNTSGGGWHPNLAGQQRFAEELVNFLLEEQLCTIGADNGLLSAAGVGRMEMTEELGGLAFQFRLDAAGVKMTTKRVASLTNATVEALGNGSACRLVGMGALVTNDPEIGTRPERMTKKNLAKNHVDAPAKYLMKADGGDAWFAVRVTNIPAMFADMLIYARPYYVFEVDDRQAVVYGEIVLARYEGSPNRNDGVSDR